jgi:hypothetical protein
VHIAVRSYENARAWLVATRSASGSDLSPDFCGRVITIGRRRSLRFRVTITNDLSNRRSRGSAAPIAFLTSFTFYKNAPHKLYRAGRFDQLTNTVARIYGLFLIHASRAGVPCGAARFSRCLQAPVVMLGVKGSP